MSNYFTYEECLTLQKNLWDSKSFKSITTELDENPTAISRKIKNILLNLQQVIPDIRIMHVKTE